MTIVPECCDKRFVAIDALVKDITGGCQGGVDGKPCPCGSDEDSNQDLGECLMVRFWDYLKGHPGVDMENAVQRQTSPHIDFDDPPCQAPLTEMDSAVRDKTRRDLKQMIQTLNVETCNAMNNRGRSNKSRDRSQACGSGRPKAHNCIESEEEPLTQALQGIKAAQTHDSNCAWRLNELMQAEERMCAYMRRLEARELHGVAQLQQADAMWTAMEEEYARKLYEAKMRYDMLLAKEKEVRENLCKWKKADKQRNKQLKEMENSARANEMKAKQKRRELDRAQRDMDSMRQQIENMEKEIENVKATAQSNNESFEKEKQDRFKEMTALENQLEQEVARREEKKKKGHEMLKEAREKLSTACKVHLMAQMQAEEYKAEEAAINAEMELMRDTIKSCNEKCKMRMDRMDQEIKTIDKQTDEVKRKCSRCHKCNSTTDIKRMCYDCPRCERERDCIFDSSTKCHNEPNRICPCYEVKCTFLENVLENMYNILEADSKGPGKELAEEILNTLKSTNNAMLPKPMREKLHSYIMQVVEKNLDSSIMGGAVKTRCEMDPVMLKQLKQCLEEIVIVPPPPPPPAADKGQPKPPPKDQQPKSDVKPEAKKGPCKAWGGPTTCGCAGGPEACVCSKQTKSSHSGAKATCGPEIAFQTSRLADSKSGQIQICKCGGTTKEVCRCASKGSVRSKGSIKSHDCSSRKQKPACVISEPMKSSDGKVEVECTSPSHPPESAGEALEKRGSKGELLVACTNSHGSSKAASKRSSKSSLRKPSNASLQKQSNASLHMSESKKSVTGEVDDAKPVKSSGGFFCSILGTISASLHSYFCGDDHDAEEGTSLGAAASSSKMVKIKPGKRPRRKSSKISIKSSCSCASAGSKKKKSASGKGSRSISRGGSAMSTACSSMGMEDICFPKSKSNFALKYPTSPGCTPKQSKHSVSSKGGCKNSSCNDSKASFIINASICHPLIDSLYGGSLPARKDLASGNMSSLAEEFFANNNSEARIRNKLSLLMMPSTNESWVNEITDEDTCKKPCDRVKKMRKRANKKEVRIEETTSTEMLSKRANDLNILNDPCYRSAKRRTQRLNRGNALKVNNDVRLHEPRPTIRQLGKEPKLPPFLLPG